MSKADVGARWAEYDAHDGGAHAPRVASRSQLGQGSARPPADRHALPERENRGESREKREQGARAPRAHREGEDMRGERREEMHLWGREYEEGSDGASTARRGESANGGAEDQSQAKAPPSSPRASKPQAATKIVSSRGKTKSQLGSEERQSVGACARAPTDSSAGASADASAGLTGRQPADRVALASDDLVSRGKHISSDADKDQDERIAGACNQDDEQQNSEPPCEPEAWHAFSPNARPSPRTSRSSCERFRTSAPEALPTRNIKHHSISEKKEAMDKAKVDEQESMKRVAWLRRYLLDTKRKAAMEEAAKKRAAAAASLRENKLKRFGQHAGNTLAETPAATAEELMTLSIRFNREMRHVFPPPITPTWFKLFRIVDEKGIGKISLSDWTTLARQRLEISNGDNADAVTDQALRAAWQALDPKGTGCVTSGDFGAFMRKGEEQVNPGSGPRTSTQTKAGSSPASKESRQSEESAHVNGDSPDFRSAAASEAELLALSRWFNQRLSDLYPPPATPSWYKLFRQADEKDLGRLSFAQFKAMTRAENPKGLAASETDIGPSTLARLFKAITDHGRGILTCGSFGAFMRKGEDMLLHRSIATSPQARGQRDDPSVSTAQLKTPKQGGAAESLIPKHVNARKYDQISYELATEIVKLKGEEWWDGQEPLAHPLPNTARQSTSTTHFLPLMRSPTKPLTSRTSREQTMRIWSVPPPEPPSQPFRRHMNSPRSPAKRTMQPTSPRTPPAKDSPSHGKAKNRSPKRTLATISIPAAWVHDVDALREKCVAEDLEMDPETKALAKAKQIRASSPSQPIPERDSAHGRLRQRPMRHSEQKTRLGEPPSPASTPATVKTKVKALGAVDEERVPPRSESRGRPSLRNQSPSKIVSPAPTHVTNGNDTVQSSATRRTKPASVRSSNALVGTECPPVATVKTRGEDNEAGRVVELATHCFEMLAKMSSGGVDPEEMRQMMPRLAACFGRSIKWDVPDCALTGRGSFIELMSALGPIWQDLSVTKAEVRSVEPRGETVAVVRTMYTVHMRNWAGQVVEGTEGDVEVGVSVRFRRGKIVQWYQEFQKHLLDEKRQLALAAQAAEAATIEAAEEEDEDEENLSPLRLHGKPYNPTVNHSSTSRFGDGALHEADPADTTRDECEEAMTAQLHSSSDSSSARGASAPAKPLDATTDGPLISVKNVDAGRVVELATHCFEMLAKMSSGGVDPEEMRQMMPRLAACFGRSIKWDVPDCALTGRGSFIELMSALGPIWQDLSVTKAEVRSVEPRGETVAVVRTMYTVHMRNWAGQVVEGTEGDVEVGVSVRFRRGKIVQWYQEFQKHLLDEKRQLALAAQAAEAATIEAAEEEDEDEENLSPLRLHGKPYNPTVNHSSTSRFGDGALHEADPVNATNTTWKDANATTADRDSPQPAEKAPVEAVDVKDSCESECEPDKQ